jgi:hypothetical protein
VGVTAHRNLIASEIPGIEAAVHKFFSKLAQDYPGLTLQLITPLAEGGDQLAARVALSMDLPVIAVLPMEQEEYERDFISHESIAEFRELLDNCRQVIRMPRESGIGVDSLHHGSIERDRLYAQSGIFVSNHCQVLLALWDGRSSSAVGGTAQIVHYHLTGAMEGFADGQASADLLANNENDLAYHIVCSRGHENGHPAEGLEPLRTYWITSLRGREDSTQIPDEYRLMLDRLKEFDEDEEKYREEIETSGSTLLEGLPSFEIPAGVRHADLFFRTADWLALHFQKRVHLSMRSTYLLAALMGLVFLLYSEYSGSAWMVLLFLALFFVGVAFHFIGERRQWHRKYLDYRALAEGLRVQIYWNLSGVVDPASAEFAYDSFLNKQDVELGWIRHVMRTASMQRARGSEPDPRWVEWVVERWIGQEGSGDGQLAYYSSKTHQNAIHHQRTGMLGNICLWSGIGVAFLLLLFGSRASEEQLIVMMILMGALPLIAGVRAAYAHKKAEKELIRQYDFMSRIFGNARQLLDESSELHFQRRVLRALGEAALEEGAEWILMHRERPLEYSGL